jgi:hypothetical protein
VKAANLDQPISIGDSLFHVLVLPLTLQCLLRPPAPHPNHDAIAANSCPGTRCRRSSRRRPSRPPPLARRPGHQLLPANGAQEIGKHSEISNAAVHIQASYGKYKTAKFDATARTSMRLLPSFNLAGELRAPTSPELPLLRRGG